MTASAQARPLSEAGQTRLIGVVATVHGVSHFYHLLLASMFPWLREAFGFSYAELGLLMTVFFVVSGIGQASSGFLVDRIGARPVLIASLFAFILSCLVLATASGYAQLMAGAVLAGLGNSTFHPVDFSILNARIRNERLAKAYALHGVFGSLGWALAPLLLTSVAALADWRAAYIAAMLPALCGLALAVWAWGELEVSPMHAQGGPAGAGAAEPIAVSALLRMPALWFSALYFLSIALALGAIQSFGTESVRLLRDLEPSHTGYLLSLFMVANALGTLAGGYVLRNPDGAERVVTLSFAAAAVCALVIGLLPLSVWMVPVMFCLLGFASGVAGPARDMLVKRATPAGSSGRVYGLVYSALDVGIAIAPSLFGLLMDAGLPVGIWVGVASAYGVLIASANLLGRSTRR